MEYKFKNAVHRKIFIAIFISSCIFFLALLGVVLSLIAKQTEKLMAALIIFGILLVVNWVIFFITYSVFCGKIVVTENQISLRLMRKIVWVVKKEEILECVYTRLFVNSAYYPTAGEMYFVLKETKSYATRKIAKGMFSLNNYIVITKKQVDKIAQLGYNVKIIN